ncbi:alpha/beta hydrolase [Bacillus sp. MUM 116]|uniref:alpha/beta fold hydrolase n=1 Tax=Bacillus sp. MUM 116 TaxID=1678002 RepID=UPI0008F5DEE5|nr:alpha/beta hydrolase [Bacillus sp. MUM 116]OIK12996.1 alpha/beta hydrolase [Bacillus sp. MUM 116]
MGKGTIYKSAEGKRRIFQHYENYLQSLKFEVERIYINTSFGKTHMLVAGPAEGKPLFLFQGGNCINPMTLSWFSPLTDQYRIYAPDTIGHPGYSDETRISAKDESFSIWVEELMDYLGIKSCGFIGASYGAGIVLRLASFKPEKIDCSVLVSPAGIQLGSKMNMIKNILLPLILFKATSFEQFLIQITGAMSNKSMKKIDKQIIADIFQYIKLEQDMPKLTEKEELRNYHSPTLVIAGKKDIFFPESSVGKAAKEIIPKLIECKSFDMGHFPSEEHLLKINNEIFAFLSSHY